MNTNKVVSKWVIMCKHWSKTHKNSRPKIDTCMQTKAEEWSGKKRSKKRGWEQSAFACVCGCIRILSMGLYYLFIDRVYKVRRCHRWPDSGLLTPATYTRTHHIAYRICFVKYIYVYKPISRFQWHKHNDKSGNVLSQWTIFFAAIDAAAVVIVVILIVDVVFFLSFSCSSFFYALCFRQAIYINLLIPRVYCCAAATHFECCVCTNPWQFRRSNYSHLIADILLYSTLVHFM